MTTYPTQEQEIQKMELQALRDEMYRAQELRAEKHNAAKRGTVVCTCGHELHNFYNPNK